MLQSLLSTILFASYATNNTNITLKERPNYLTSDDFTRGRQLPSVVPDGTVLQLPHHDVHITKRNVSRTKRNAWKYGTWPNARVPYTLDPNFDSNQRAAVARALENYHSKTCVRFVAKLPTDIDYVQILRDDTTCGLAQICRNGGAQYAKFGGTCINSGVMTHELGHTLCFGHEHTRSDRDNYISIDSSKCVPPGATFNKDNANDFTTLDLMYDYVSLQHYEGECYSGCFNPKLPGVTKCGSGGDLSVLDAEKINAFYNCGGCYSYRFKPISLITSTDNLVSGGVDGDNILYPCRGYYNGNIYVGKSIPKWKACWIGYGGKEFQISDFEVLTNPKNVNINWIKRPTDGSFPTNAIRGGRSAERENVYIGRCTVQFNGKITTIVGKIQRSASTGLYITYGGAEYICNDYDILVCN